MSAAPGISLNFVSDSSPWPQERPARRRRGKTGAKKKSSAKKTSAAEPPTLTPAAGFVSGESQGSRPSLYEFLRDRGYLIDRTSADLMKVVLELPGIRAVLLEGPPGVGKTALTEKIAQWLGAEYIYVLATPNTDEDVLLYKFVPDENTKSGIRVAEGPVTQAVKKAASGRKVVLVIDEFDKTRPSTDALLLDLLQNGRVTLYLGGKEDVLVADPNNLYIFLTSNNVREFSEPLMRRLIRIDFKYLDPSDVADLLKRRFDGQTAGLLAEIYRDTVEAGLRKPATLQELIQLGYVLKKMSNAPLDRLLRMFVIKYEDDWERFKEYLKQKMQSPAVAPQSQQQPAYEAQVINMSGVARPGLIAEQLYTFKAPFSDDVYTAIAKISAPGRSPDEVGKFRVMQIDGERVVVSKEPLTIDEYLHLYDNARSGFEAYVEDKLLMVIPDDVEELINAANSVGAYSERYVAVVADTGDAKEEVHIELPEPLTDQTKIVEATIKAYAKAEDLEDDNVYRPVSPLLARLREMHRHFCSKRLKLRKGTADVVSNIISRCAAEDTSVSIKIEGMITNRDVEEIEKALAAKGFEVERSEYCKSNNSEIAVEKSYRRNSIRITCWQ